MDIVYPLGGGSIYRNMELRFSLRSLQFVDHDKVFIIGQMPLRWLQRVEFIKLPDIKKQKQRSVIKKLLFICQPESPVSEDFILMNDDFYFLERQEIKLYKGFMDLEELRNKYPTSSYGRALQTTIEFLKFKKLQLTDYEIHYPFVFNKTKFRDLFNQINLDAGPMVYRSIYGNHYKLPAEPIEDFKIYNTKDFYKQKVRHFLSTDTIIPDLYNFKKFIMERVGKRSQYEMAFKFEKY